MLLSTALAAVATGNVILGAPDENGGNHGTFKVDDNCSICEEAFVKVVDQCASYHKGDHQKFLDCFWPNLQKVENTPDECVAYTMDENMTGCDSLMCLILDQYMPGICPDKGAAPNPVVDGKTECGLGPKDEHYSDEEWANCINAKAKTWTAAPNDRSVESFQKNLGVKLETQIRLPLKDASMFESYMDTPTDFDARTAFPDCASVIGHIRDQSDCGSCWAHGTTEAFNDRKCIATKGNFTTLLSVSDTTGCCGFLSCMSMGCNGGQVATPWAWFHRTGVVSGGDFGDGKFCYDYTMPQCAHHVNSTTLPDCSDVKQVGPKCLKSCPSNDKVIYDGDKHMSSDKGYGFRNTADIQKDLMQYGSVTAAFTVYADFPNYKSGVYKHTSGKALGGHAVKIIGWGVESGEQYWLVANSWNDSWGAKGLFKIAFGDCGIDSQCHAGHA